MNPTRREIELAQNPELRALKALPAEVQEIINKYPQHVQTLCIDGEWYSWDLSRLPGRICRINPDTPPRTIQTTPRPKRNTIPVTRAICEEPILSTHPAGRKRSSVTLWYDSSLGPIVAVVQEEPE